MKRKSFSILGDPLPVGKEQMGVLTRENETRYVFTASSFVPGTSASRVVWKRGLTRLRYSKGRFRMVLTFPSDHKELSEAVDRAFQDTYDCLLRLQDLLDRMEQDEKGGRR